MGKNNFTYKLNIMTDRNFIENASIAAMQGLLHRPGVLVATNIAEKSVIIAEQLLYEISKHEYSNEENDAMTYIQEVDETQGRLNIKIYDRLDNLEYKLNNLIRVIEENSPHWINHPVTGIKKEKDGN